MGKRICKELRAKPLPFVVIDKHPDMIAALQREGFMAVEGDATQDEVLIRAGIERAKGVVSVVNTDTENLYIELTARGLNKDLYIVARAGDEGSEQKLMRAGATRVLRLPRVTGLIERCLPPASALMTGEGRTERTSPQREDPVAARPALRS